MAKSLFSLGAVALLVATAISAAGKPPQAKGGRNYTGGRFMLDIMGANAGILDGPPSGIALGRTTGLTTGGRLLTLKMGLSMGQPIYDWINASWTANPNRKNGAIIAADSSGRAMAMHQFQSALITEVGFPAFDVARTSTAVMAVKLQPERMTTKRGGTSLPRTVNDSQRDWLCSNFRMEVAGLPGSKISKVDAFTVKSKALTGLSFHVNHGDAPAWRSRMNATDELPGALIFLAPNGKDELGRLSFRLAKVRMVQTSPSGPGPDGQPRSVVWAAISQPRLSVSR